MGLSGYFSSIRAAPDLLREPCHQAGEFGTLMYTEGWIVQLGSRKWNLHIKHQRGGRLPTELAD